MGPKENLESELIGMIFLGIFYGLYCVIYALYLRIQLKKRDGFKGLLVYALTLNFIMCTAYLAVDMSSFLQLVQTSCRSSPEPQPASVGYLELASNVLYTCIDLISQGILIYRCWISWHRSLVVVVPVILSIAFLAVSLILLAGMGTMDAVRTLDYHSVVLSMFFISMAVNALVTGLIVYKIVMQLKARATYYVGGGSRDLYLSISILVESGMITFIAQLLQIILYMTDSIAYTVVSNVVLMLYGISPTLVLVRVVMGLTYDTKTSRITTSHPIRFAGVESNNKSVEVTTGHDPEDNLRIAAFESNNKPDPKDIRSLVV